VALAFPFYAYRATVMRALVPMLAALVVGSLVAIVSAVTLGLALGVPREVVVAMAPKSVTTGVAMGIVEGLGGDPTLAAVLVMLTGMTGAILVTPILNLLRLRDMRARGFAAGLAAHGVGTARAFQVSEVAGTFAGIALGLNAFLTAILVPVAVSFLR
jgi:putative effector of murein hydrolase